MLLKSCFYVRASLCRLCVQYFWCEGCFWHGCQPCVSSECGGHYPLDRGCDLHCGALSLFWMWGGASSLPCGCHHPLQGWVCSPVVTVEAPRSSSIRFHCPWVHVLPQRKWLLNQVRPVWSQRTYACTAWVGICSQAAHGRVSSCFVHPRCSARLWCAVDWGWVSGCCGCRNWGGCVAAWDLVWLCSRLLPGSVCPRSGTRCSV